MRGAVGDEHEAFARRWTAGARSVPRGGQRGGTIARLVQAIGSEAEVRRRDVLDVSRRQMAEWANCSQAGAQKHLGALAEEGWLVSLHRGSVRSRARWKLTIPPGAAIPDEAAGAVIGHPLDDPSHDFWAGSSFGAHFRVWHAMDTQEPLTIKEIAEMLGINDRSIRRNLYAMRERGLCSESAKTWVRLIPPGLGYDQHVARDRRAERHANERRYFERNFNISH